MCPAQLSNTPSRLFFSRLSRCPHNRYGASILTFRVRTGETHRRCFVLVFLDPSPFYVQTKKTNDISFCTSGHSFDIGPFIFSFYHTCFYLFISPVYAYSHTYADQKMEESVYKPLGSDRQYIEYPPKETDEESDDGLGERTFRNLHYEQLRANPRQPPRLDPFPSSRSTAFPSRSAGFDIIVQGVLEGAECHEADVLFARTYWVYGPDWTTHNSLSGGDTRLGEVPLVRSLGQQCQSEVVTQLSVVSADPFSRFTWSAPFECSLQSTNPHGWPQLVVTLHTVKGAIPQRSKASEDQTSGSRSGEQCVSYSRCFIPMQNGMHRKRLPLLQLRPSTTKQSFISWLTGQRPELRDPMFLCTGEDRCVLTAAPLTGHVSLTLSVTISGLRECGIGT